MMCVAVYACDKERTALCCECCDCVNLRNWTQLFGKQVLENGGWSGIRQDDLCVVVGREPCAAVQERKGGQSLALTKNCE